VRLDELAAGGEQPVRDEPLRRVLEETRSEVDARG
jgi:hypothetical protein